MTGEGGSGAPPRIAFRPLTRFGFLPDDEVTCGGTTFGQYRLTRQRWHDVIGNDA